MASQDVEPVGGAPAPKRRRTTRARASIHGTPDALLTAAKSGWGTTFRYSLLLLIHRAPVPVVGLVAYQVARARGWL